MNGPGYHLFASPRLAGNKHRRLVGPAEDYGKLEYLLHRGAGHYDLLQGDPIFAYACSVPPAPLWGAAIFRLHEQILRGHGRAEG